MTLKQLQRYLETEKWRETAKRGADVCGSYARCAYCNRYDEYPCAEAYRRYFADPSREESDFALPEPPVRRTFGTESVEENSAPREEKKVENKIPVRESAIPARHEHRINEGIPVTRLVRKPRENAEPLPEPVQAASLQAEPPKTEPREEPEAKATRAGVIRRGRGGADNTRVLVIYKKGNYGEAEF